MMKAWCDYIHPCPEPKRRKMESEVKKKKEYKQFKMHIDGIQEITTVDNYKVKLTRI